MAITWRIISGEQEGENVGKSHRKQEAQFVGTKQGEVKNDKGNRETEEFICTTH